MELAYAKKELREVQEHVQAKHRQSYDALASELNSMREMQREVKSRLAGLKAMADHVAEQQKQRGVAVSKSSSRDPATDKLGQSQREKKE